MAKRDDYGRARRAVAAKGNITTEAKALLIAYADLLATATEDAFLIDNEADFFAMDIELLKAAATEPKPGRLVVFAAIGIARWYAENVLKKTLTALIQESLKSTFATDLYAAVQKYPHP